MEDFYDLVDRAVDTAFEENKFYFKAYDYLIANKIKRKQITEFIESSTAVALGTLVDDLEGYLKDSKTISLEPEQKESINVELIENVGEIYVNVSPKNALVSIDNRPVGTGSQMLKLPAKKT